MTKRIQPWAGAEGGESCGKSASLETPQAGVFCRGGSSRARGKRPPATHALNVSEAFFGY
ncbi:hypothetical protein D7Z54_23220 [Salibacterium salarium]|uniref:Uncharacterized protein n=1 Tax=Salibacterium salarium TaxID=284579 RepID=A0A428MXM0_9BACI|nr:hypothetical protein D7Z54_23220 [Salibacterium salarium]